MKLAIIATEFPPKAGGMEQHALGLATALAPYLQVLVFTDIQHSTHHYQLPFPVNPLLNRTRKDFLTLSRQDVDAFLVLNAGYAFLSRFTRLPVFVYCHGNDYLNPWILSAPSLFYRTLDALRNVPYFWRYTTRLRRRLNRHQVSKGFARVSGIFVNSQYTAKKLVHEYPKINCTVDVSYPGVPDHFFTDPPQQRHPGASWRFLTVARLSRVARKKNVDNVLRALSTLSDSIEFEYLVIGDGDLRPSLQALADELGISNSVSFLGELPNDDVKSSLDLTDLFLLPSKSSETDVESFGIVYAEAAARGVPSLASREGGAVDAISHGHSGIIIERSDPQSISSGILQYTENATAFHAETIRAWSQNFSWNSATKIIRKRLADTVS
jgi:glycosyltransferase involved in cell wall biosynthesis